MVEELVKPQEIQLIDNAIVIQWSDGHQGIYPPRMLRLRCPCAQCVDEMTGKVRLDPARVPQGVQAVDHLPVGNYALQFLWSDTHHTGIYPYRLLRQMCTCLGCNEERAQ